jgi:ApaG protein
MITAITEGIRISVQSRYEPNFNNPLGGSFLFAYFITIENENPFDVQLLRRHWFIWDSNGVKREVEGRGVVGLQPVIEAGKKYSYNSACDLHTVMGKMHGTYEMRRMDNKRLFTVQVPEFHMEVPYSLN